MHFRRRGNSVQIVKTQPAGEGGKAVSRPIGSANLATGEISEQAAAALTPEETLEVKGWITRHQAVQTAKREIEYRTLADTLGEVARWIRDADAKLLEEHAGDVRDALRRVRRELDRRVGEGGPDQQEAGPPGRAAGTRPPGRRGGARGGREDQELDQDRD
jgi:hypothetical protein